jgi:hypothetical protein
MTRAEMKRRAEKIGKKIQQLMNELETLEYSGLAMAFSQENTIAIGTSKTLKCFYPEFVEYVHAVIIAANPPDVPKFFDGLPSQTLQGDHTPSSQPSHSAPMPKEERKYHPFSSSSATKKPPRSAPM